MLQQNVAQGLLALAVAVNEDYLTPQRAAAFVGELCLVNTAGDWRKLVGDRQFLSPDQLKIVQMSLEQSLRRHEGDALAALQHWDFDPLFWQQLERLELPQIDRVLRWLETHQPAHRTGSDTTAGDHYVTTPSQRPTQLPAGDDPFTTGYGSHSAPEQRSQSQPDVTEQLPKAAVPSVIELNGGDESISQAATTADAVTPGAADFVTQAPATLPADETSTLHGEYATLPSALDLTTSFPSHASALPASRELRFRVLREHAKGGLGKVSVAQDLELNREVAFKEIQRRYADDVEARSRFLLEAEITGGLEHPGIVPVYGLGTYADGCPYYAMRFIRGRSLQQAIEDYFRAAKQGADTSTQQYELSRLLRRFVDVCHAIDYAHSRGILHRDLKPGNVMLGDYGETLVVDWGIAKAMHEPQTADAVPLARLTPRAIGESTQTMAGTVIGTPQFMSPEQAQGKNEELRPTSDVYSLGATLYCLLTGVPPFISRDFNTVQKLVIDGVFPEPRLVNPKVPKPLNAICLKAMALAPADRYGSARALAEDLEHWLADEPVSAYQENRRELWGRWMRRNQSRAQALVASVIAIALISIAAVILVDQSRRAVIKAKDDLQVARDNEIVARKQEMHAKQEALRRSRQTREAIDTLLSGVSEALDEFPGMQDARRRLLERAAEDYEKLAAEKSTDPDLQIEAARSLVRLGDVQTKLNLLAEARGTFERAQRLLDDSLTKSTRRTEISLEAALNLTRRAALELTANAPEQAVNYYQAALAILNDQIEQDAASIELKDALGTTLVGLGNAYQAQQQLDAAGEQLEQARSVFQKLQSEHPRDVRITLAAAHAETSYGRFLFDSSRPAAGVEHYDRAITLLDRLVEDYPDEPEYFERRATARISLAEALRFLGEWPRVVRNDEACAIDLQEVVRAEPDVPRHRENLAVARLNLGQSQRKLGSNTTAAITLGLAVENFTELAASYPLARYVEALGNARTTLAQVLSDLDQQDRAMELITLAVADYHELLNLQVDNDGYSEGLGIVLRHRARILARRGDVAAADQEFQAAIDTLQRVATRLPQIGRVTDHLAWAWINRGQVQFSAGNADAARQSFETGLRIREKLVVEHPDSPQYQDNLAWVLATCPVAELRNGGKAVELTRKLTADYPQSTQFWLTHGAALLVIEKPDEAMVALQKSAGLRGVDDGFNLVWQALAAQKMNQPDTALDHLQATIEWQRQQRPADEELRHWIDQAQKELATAVPPVSPPAETPEETPAAPSADTPAETPQQ